MNSTSDNTSKGFKNSINQHVKLRVLYNFNSNYYYNMRYPRVPMECQSENSTESKG